MQSYTNIKMKANRKQTAVKLTVSKIGTYKYGKLCLHEVVTPFLERKIDVGKALTALG